MEANGLVANGSSPTGHCNDTTNVQRIGRRRLQANCSQPTSSVLFDGVIPTLTELDGNMWASRLLTMRARPFAAINFDFVGVAGYAGVGRVEIVTFNCPQWGIGVGNITLHYPIKFEFTSYNG